MKLQSYHGGNLYHYAKISGLKPSQILDFSANINPAGPPKWLHPTVEQALVNVCHYPDPDYTELVDEASKHFSIPTDEIIFGNGSEEILHCIPSALNRPHAVIPCPCYLDYAKTAQRSMLVHPIQLVAQNDFCLDLETLASTLLPGDVVYLGHPNNPTGRNLDTNTLIPFIENHPDTIFIIDEAFADLASNHHSLIPYRFHNTIILRSLTKNYAIPGLRIGLAIARPNVIDAIRAQLPHWNVNSIAEAVTIRAFKDDAYLPHSLTEVEIQRSWLRTELSKIPFLKTYHSDTNFLLIQILDGTPASHLAFTLLKQGIAIRDASNIPGLDDTYIRIAVRNAEENQRLIESLRCAFKLPTPRALKKRITPAIMLQGTSSNAGKSIMAAALCRIFRQDGLDVAPFKSQNISLNSYVTALGEEMGRAQVVQAQACEIRPAASMNPILVKPAGIHGSQIILMGRAIGHMSIRDYTKFKPEAFKIATQAYDELANHHQIMVLEGAGSPAEVNLKHHDISNMAMANHANAKVLMVGDIDRGGIYASLLGTMHILNPDERQRVIGYLINRFRGDTNTLQPANHYLSEITQRPVIGTIPFIPHLSLPDEDSVNFHSMAKHHAARRSDAIRVAIIRLPHGSNDTDFAPLLAEPDVEITLADTPADLDNKDAIIIPGSKSVVADLDYLRHTGMAASLQTISRNRIAEVIGICGGYQMLGISIDDPSAVESESLVVNALNLLPMITTMASTKTLTNTSAIHLPSGLPVHGFEIHHGQATYPTPPTSIIQTHTGHPLGIGDATTWGTYLHGLFDADDFRRWWINRLRSNRGLPTIDSMITRYQPLAELNRLADVVRAHIDLPAIYRHLGL